MHVAEWSTGETEPQKRLALWNDVTSSFFPGMVVDAANDIQASWQSVQIGQTNICIAKAPKSRVSRWIDRSDIQATGRSLFHLQTRGFSNTISGQNSAVCATGEMTACHSDDPYEIEVSHNNECLVIDCPDSSISVAPLKGRSLSVTQSIHMRMLYGFVLNIFEQKWENSSPSVTEEAHLEDALLALLKNCVSSIDSIAQEPTKAPVDAQDVYKRAVAFISEHLGDSGVRTGLVAKRLGVGEHIVQRAFAKFGTTPTAYILDTRLKEAERKLANGQFTGSLTDLAHELGFSDSSHFSRKFKTHFKVTPSQFLRNRRN